MHDECLGAIVRAIQVARGVLNVCFTSHDMVRKSVLRGPSVAENRRGREGSTASTVVLM